MKTRTCLSCRNCKTESELAGDIQESAHTRGRRRAGGQVLSGRLGLGCPLPSAFSHCVSPTVGTPAPSAPGDWSPPTQETSPQFCLACVRARPLRDDLSTSTNLDRPSTMCQSLLGAAGAKYKLLPSCSHEIRKAPDEI